MPFSESLKAQVRKKAHLACCLCKSLGVEVHHIIPESEDGPDTEENAVPLCPSCHETYGANPQKRKFIREARDLWYEICENKLAPGKERLDEIKQLLQNTVSYEDFQGFKEELLSRLDAQLGTPRSEEEIGSAIDEFFDKIWYDRHQLLKHQVENGRETVNPDIWFEAKEAAAKIEAKYPKSELGPHSDFDWGMINGKLSALRWIMGDEWDFLDT
jgi:hypothetical protein